MAFLLKLLMSLTSLFKLCDSYYFVFLFLAFFCKSFESHEDKSENYLLCKYCGADAADLEYAFTIESPAAIKIENQTFSGKEIVVQTLKNPSNVYFEVITLRKSNCVGYGEWTKHDSWFPGHAWKLCVCQPWGHFLGCVKMTDEQAKFLKELEEEFKNRYTEDDEEFQAVVNTKLPPPPIVEDWWEFWRGNNRFHHDGYSHSSRRDERYSPWRGDNAPPHSHRHQYRGRERTAGGTYRP